MTENTVYIADLIGRHLENTITPEERIILEEWINTSDHNRQIFAGINNSQEITAILQKFYSYDSNRIARKIGEQVPEFRTPEKAPVRRMNAVWKWGWVAAALLLFAGGTYFLAIHKNTPTPSVAALNVPNIIPGKEGAVLTLADGRKVVLDSLGNGVIAMQNGAKVILKNGELQYALSGETSGDAVYNTMSTPKGRQFQITLPDGTKVWLNSASSLRFPTAFSGTDRRVEISGEAYFEVAHNAKQPFFVKINNRAELQVLGTWFNVNAYEDEKAINTTLLQGSVKVSVAGTADQQGRSDIQGTILKPGQQAQIKVGTKIQQGIVVIPNADIDKVMAWKNGAFNFNGADLGTVMRQLERWYDIDVVYEKGIPDIRFFGKMSRDVSLADLLKLLEASEVHFRIEEGRKLVVIP